MFQYLFTTGEKVYDKNVYLTHFYHKLFFTSALVARANF